MRINAQVNATVHDSITSYPTATKILNTYKEELKSLGICFFLEGSSIVKTDLGDTQFGKVLKFALEMMKEEIYQIDVPGRKYIQIKSMYEQHKLFLKCTYSSERDLAKDNRYFDAIEQILDKKSGYIHVENREYENILMLAIPAGH